MIMNRDILNRREFYETADLSIAAVITLYYPIEGIDRQNPQRALFIFKRDENLDNLIEAYWKDELKVSPQAYFNQLRTIKARLYNRDEN